MLVEVTTTLVWVMSPDGKFLESQPSFQAFTGLEYDEILGDGWTHALHPDDVQRVKREWTASLAGKVRAEICYRLRRHDGEYRFMRARAIPMLDSQGQIEEWLGANDDVTDALRADVESRERERRLQEFADTLPHIAWESDLTGAVIWVNSRFYEFTGLRIGEGLLWAWADAFHPDDIAAFLAAWRGTVATDTIYRHEARMRRYDGAMRWMLFAAESQEDANTGVRRWYGTATDIEESRRASERIHRFVATLSHELRNPLAPVRNGLLALGSSALSESARSSTIGMMERQVSHMVRLIDDLMDFNRIASDKLILRLAPADLRSEITQAVEVCTSLFAASQHSVTLSMPPQKLTVLADQTRLAQIFGNLLTNAAKYSHPGSEIRIRVFARDKEAIVEVEDDGIGLAADRISDVFQFLAQVDPGGALGGLGIGLSIASRLAEMHGGSIRARSEGLGKGSCFTVSLPLSSVECEPPGLPRQNDLKPGKGRRILLVDDNRDAADSLAILTQMMGHETRVAYDGAEALAAVAEFRPHIVVLDIGLPDIEGYTLAPRIRDAMADTQVMLIALTGWGQDSDRLRSEKAGFDAHLVKPVDPGMLEKLFASVGA